MTITARSAFRRAWEDLIAVVREITGSHYEISTTIQSGRLERKFPKKAKIKAKVTMPSKKITDPTFKYRNSAQTDVAETFKGVTSVHGLQQHSDSSRIEDEKFVGKVPESKVRRIRG